MKYLLAATSAFSLISLIFFARSIKGKYDFGFYYINKAEEAKFLEAEQQSILNSPHPANYDNAMDLRGTPTHLCPCGCNIWNVKVMFEDFEIATYFLEMECANCGSMATAPTPLDRESME